MTREEAKELLPIIKAYADGKTVQVLDGVDGTWDDLNAPVFDGDPSIYRIKPEPKYRPFKTKEECWNEMQKHQPFGWIRLDDMYINIVCVHSVDKQIELSSERLKFEYGIPVNIERMFIPFERAFNEYIFADGAPFGIKEE